ncbi:hypothetical protein BDF21DRAFT_417664 [Thamnidium elegans]|uniref:SET domain-containing protein n=1 Tax=Thamnidium elegans TaxID=101142 RepID=A0A8H7VUD7_9FUNG|nr:hypothetical protein INT48_000333 [Thamnidium elegans]KAI8082355.1 hypothetical protein BDF21DRAFT_417664 [Thamnidium elegans]
MLQVDTLHKRLTPAHIGLSTWLPNQSFTTICQVTIKDSLTEGKYQVANKPFRQGDIVLKEEPFIRQLNKSQRKDHCYFCFRSLTTKSVVKCRVKTCKWEVIYCDRVCEGRGWLVGHAWLCRFPELDVSDMQEVVFGFIGFVTSRCRGQNILPGLVSNMESNNIIQDMRTMEKIDKIASLFYLSEDTIDSLICILSQIRCNSFAIKQAASVAVDSSYVVSRESIHLGQAVYLTASRFNHDCDPTALVIFGSDGNPCQLQVQVTKGAIVKGQSVTISYGPLATKHAKEERKKKLKEDYFFNCQCSSCVGNREESPNSIYKCQICKVSRLYRQQDKCRNCDQKPYWAYFLKTEAEIEMYKQQQDYLKVLQLQENIYHDNALSVGETCDKLAQIYCVSGQMRLAAKYSKRSLEVAKAIYGKISVEAAEEMMKLSTLLFNSMQKAEAIKQINETMIVYKILGLSKSSPEDIEELGDMKNHLIYIVR